MSTRRPEVWMSSLIPLPHLFLKVCFKLDFCVFILHAHVCMCVGACTVCVCGVQRTAFGSSFFPSTMWVLGIECRSSAFHGKCFTLRDPLTHLLFLETVSPMFAQAGLALPGSHSPPDSLPSIQDIRGLPLCLALLKNFSLAVKWIHLVNHPQHPSHSFCETETPYLLANTYPSC